MKFKTFIDVKVTLTDWHEIKAGDIFTEHGYGMPPAKITVTRVTDKSVFYTTITPHEFRLSLKTVCEKISNNLWRKVK